MAITTTTLPPSKGVSSYQSVHSWDREGPYLGIYSQSPQCCNVYNDARLPATTRTRGWLVKLLNMHLHGVVFLKPGIHFNLPQFHPVNHAFPTTGRCCIRCSLTNISHLTYSYRVWLNLRIIHTLVVSALQLGQSRTQVVIYLSHCALDHGPASTSIYLSKSLHPWPWASINITPVVGQ